MRQEFRDCLDRGKIIRFPQGKKLVYCLYIALQGLFADRGKLPPDLVESFRHAMSLRETADYRSDFSEEGARLVTESAERLLKRTIGVLEMVS